MDLKKKYIKAVDLKGVILDADDLRSLIRERLETLEEYEPSKMSGLCHEIAILSEALEDILAEDESEYDPNPNYEKGAGHRWDGHRYKDLLSDEEETDYNHFYKIGGTDPEDDDE